MELAAITGYKIITMFVIVIMGVICYKTGVITKKGNECLSDVLLLLVSPLLIFVSYQREFSMDQLQTLIISTGLAAISHVISILVSGILIKRGRNDYEIERMAIIYTNAGFMGIPLVNAVFGSEGVLYMTAYITILNIFAWTHGVFLMTGKRDKQAVLNVVKAPAVIAIILGIITYICRIRLPGLVLEPIQAVSDMNTPLAMIIAGVSLASSDLKGIMKKKSIYEICGIRLFLVPMLVILVFKLLPAEEISKSVIILATACPSASIGTMFAIRYKKNSLYASEIFGITTVLALLTIPAVMLVNSLF